MLMHRVAVAALLGAALALAGPHSPRAAAPDSSLAVWTAAGWHTFWSASRAPDAWPEGLPAVMDAVVWQAAAPGVEVGELRIAGGGTASRLRVILLRLDPGRLTFELQTAVRDAGLLGAWTVDSLPPTAAVAFNAGQFSGGRPWGWVVERGHERQPPGSGPLAMAVMFDAAGAAALLHGEEVAAARERGGAVLAFQSYPAVLMDDGVVPLPLREAGRGVDVTHRDARLALGSRRDGRLIIALTRFDALGDAAGQLPFGPTTPEVAALMGALGCQRAVLLDGGLSAQLAVRTGTGVSAWAGLRRVPLGIAAAPRPEIPAARPADRN